MRIELWDELAAMERRMDDLLRSFFGSRTRLTFPAAPIGPFRRPYVPVTDVFERKGDLVVRVELPGIDPAKDVSVALEDGALVIRGERTRKEEVREEDYYRMEASYGAFERRIPVPEGIDEAAISARYADGVLEVVVPAAAREVKARKARAIPVKTARPARAA